MVSLRSIVHNLRRTFSASWCCGTAVVTLAVVGILPIVLQACIWWWVAMSGAVLSTCPAAPLRSLRATGVATWHLVI